MHIPVQVFPWAPDFGSVGCVPRWGEVWITWETVCTVAVSPWSPPALWEGSSFSTSLPALVTVTVPFSFFFSIKAVPGVRQPFTVADSISLVTNDLEQSPVVLVFSFSLDPVPCLFPSPLTPLQTSSQLLGGSPVSLGRQPKLGIPLLAAGNTPLFLLDSCGWGLVLYCHFSHSSESSSSHCCRLLALPRSAVTPSTLVLMRTPDTGTGAFSSPSGQG